MDDNDHTYIHEMDGWMDGNHNLSIFNAVIVVYETTKYIHRETERKKMDPLFHT